MFMHHRHDTWPQTPVKGTRAYYPTMRVGVLCAVGFASALFAGCGELEPMREPEVVDLELTAARMERAHVSRSNLQLQSQMRQLQKHLSRMGKSSPAPNGQEATPLPS